MRETFYRPDFNRQANRFWHPKTLQQHITKQKIQPITNLDDLAMHSWPEEQTADDFIEFTYQQRQLAQQHAETKNQPLTSIIGTGQGSFATLEQADEFIRMERETWTS